MPAFRRLAVVFALVLVAIIILADRGLIGPLLGFLYNFPNGDKVGHFVLFGLLALLISLGFPLARANWGRLRPLTGSLILAGVVIIEELSQSFFPERTLSLLDLLASLLGIFLLGELGARLRRDTRKPQSTQTG